MARKPKVKAAIPDHYYQTIQGWFNFTGPYREMVANAVDGAHFVEVGCWKGRSAAFLGVEILKSGKNITLHCVDHFLGSDEEAHQLDGELPNLYKLFLKNMKPCVDAGMKLEIHELDSAGAAAQFKDASIDFVWLDAGHDYPSVKADLEAWMPKVKPGGYLGGDDWPMKGVGDAVTEVVGSVDIHHENGWQTWLKRL